MSEEQTPRWRSNNDGVWIDIEGPNGESCGVVANAVDYLNVLEARVARAEKRAKAAEAERDSIQHREIVAAQAEFNAMRDRAEAAEAALQRERDNHSKRYAVLAGEIANLRGLERELKTALARAREALERVKWQEDLDETCCPTGSYHCIGCYAWRGKKGQPEVHDPKCFVAAALEATQLSPTQRETDTETAPD